MKTLIFNGSPRAHGDTTFLIGELTKRLHGEIKIVNTYESSIQPCIDCRYCWEKPGCCIEDEMQSIYRDIKEADHIVIASPLYFSELTGPLLNVLSRLQTFYASKRFLKVQQIEKKKTGILILCGGGDGGPRKAEETAHTLFKLMNTTTYETVYSLCTDKISAKEDEVAIQKIIEITKQ